MTSTHWILLSVLLVVFVLLALGRYQEAMGSKDDLMAHMPKAKLLDEDMFSMGGSSHVSLNHSLMGPQGARGIQGPRGDQGPSGLMMRGYLSSSNELPKSGSEMGDTYLINNALWVWTGSIWMESAVQETRPRFTDENYRRHLKVTLG